MCVCFGIHYASRMHNNLYSDGGAGVVCDVFRSGAAVSGTRSTSVTATMTTTISVMKFTVHAHVV